MDTMKSQKLKAKKKRDNLIQNILVHFLTTLTCVLLSSYVFWLPSPIPSAEGFLFVSLPRWKPLLVNAKTLFLVASLIVVFLVGDSKGPSSARVNDLYDEYVEWSRRLRGMRTRVNEVAESYKNQEREEEEEKEERGPEVRPEPAEGDRKSGRGVGFQNSEDEGGPKSGEGGEPDELPKEDPTRSTIGDLRNPKSDKGGESEELPTEELTRRVEEFIARVNKRRWLESRSIVAIPRI